MEQLQHPLVVANLHQRRNRAVAEHRIGVSDEVAQVVPGNAVADEGFDDALGQLRVVHTRHGGDLLLAEAGQALGYVQAAIGRQAGQQDLLKVQCRGLAPGADVLHICSC